MRKRKKCVRENKTLYVVLGFFYSHDEKVLKKEKAKIQKISNKLFMVLC